MSISLVLKQHGVLDTSQLVAQICEPLLQYYGITHFNYRCSFIDGSRVVLTNDPAWLNHYYIKDYGNHKTLEGDKNTLTSEYVLWSEWEHNPYIANVVADARRHFNIDHGITLTKKHTNSVEFFHFGTTKENHKIIEFYLSNIDILDRFVLYFRERAEKLMKKATVNPIHTDIKPDINFKTPSKSLINKFLQSTDVVRILLPSSKNKRYLSKRETDCSFLFTHGNTIKSIAVMLGISANTVAGYINSTKNKLGIYKRSELSKAINNARLINIKTREIFDQVDVLKSTKSINKENEFLRATPINKVLLNIAGRSSYITNREAQCLYHLMRGLSFKETASILNIQPPTVYEHIDKIKQKFSCTTKKQLIETAWDINIAKSLYLTLMEYNLDQ